MIYETIYSMSMSKTILKAKNVKRISVAERIQYDPIRWNTDL